MIPARADAAIDAATIDAGVFALFDHLPFRIAKTVPGAKPAPPGDLIEKPKLTVKKIDPANIDFTVKIPPWCQHVLNKQPLVGFHTFADGSSIAVASNAVALIDAAHHPELGIDFSGLHGTQADEGGESNTTPFSIRDGVRDGDLVVVSVFDPMIDSQTMHLIAVDAKTGAVLWQSESSTSQVGLGVAGGYVLTSAGSTVRAYRMDTGRVAASASSPVDNVIFEVGSDAAAVRGQGDGGDDIQVTLR